MGVDCIVGAVSKMHKPASDRRKKNDRNDAGFLARQLMAHNIVEVFVPDVETEGARNLSRALEDIRDDLTRAKHRLTHLLIRWGYIWNEFNEDGKRRGSWTHAHWEWIRGEGFPTLPLESPSTTTSPRCAISNRRRRPSRREWPNAPQGLVGGIALRRSGA